MYLGSIAEFGAAFDDLVTDQQRWSEATFGKDSERGPMGALKHLEIEACEAQSACQAAMELTPGWSSESLTEELADCFLLILDASRRAGVKPMQLVEAAQRKMKVNKSREWPEPTDATTPVEHIR